MIIGLCQRFRCLPSALLAEDAALLRMLKVADLGAPERGDDATDDDGGGDW